MTAPRPVNPRRVLLVLWIALFTAMVGMGNMAPLLSTYAETLGASGLMLGFIFGSFSLVRIFVMPVVGRLSDRSGRKRFVVLGLAIQVLAAFAFLACREPWQLVAARMFQGLAGAMIIPIAMAYIGEISPPGREAAYMGWLTFALFAGFGIGPLMGGVVEDHLGFAANFVLLGALCFVAFAAVAIWLPENNDPAQLPTGRREIRYRILINNPVLRGLFVFRLTNQFAHGILAAFLPLLGEHSFGLTTTQIGIVLSTNILLTASLQPFAGSIADRVNRPAMIVFGSVVSTITFALIPFAGSFQQLLAVNCLMGLAGAINVPAASGMLAIEGKKGGMGGAMAIFNIAMSVGLAVGPIVGGLVADSYGHANAFYFAAAVSLIGLLPVVRMARALRNGYNENPSLEEVS